MRAVQIEGRRALITGATGGIGKAIARALHESGAHVLLNGRREDVLNELVRDLGSQRAEAMPADLASAGEVDALLERAGRVDILVANAALPGSGRLDDYSTDEIDRAVDVNLRAPIHLARALAPSMIERREGHLVFISSISGKVASARGSIYAATKFGLRGFATSLHDELLDEGVGVSTVFPGFISDAGMWAETGIELRPGVSTRTPEQVAAGVIKGIETNRSEIDVAPLVLRAGAWAAGISQSAVQRLQRLGGGEELTKKMAEGQRAKR
jgi:short-subunit dehydrogenase